MTTVYITQYFKKIIRKHLLIIWSSIEATSIEVIYRSYKSSLFQKKKIRSSATQEFSQILIKI